MKRVVILGVVLSLFAGQNWAGTFTTQNTLIPVPAAANGTETGDTSATTTNTIELDARVYLPDGVTAPAPGLVIVHGYGGSKNDQRVIALATDFASNGYVVVTPTVRGSPGVPTTRPELPA